MNKLQAVIDLINQGDYESAVKKLEGEILAKTDGCALQGSPDKTDWITDCNTQDVIYNLIVEAVTILRSAF